MLCAALCACAESARAPERPVVAVSVAPQRWFVERLAGPAVEVRVMLAPGASETAYEPGLAQIEAASRAALYFRVGHPRFSFERGWLDALLAGREVRVASIAPSGQPATGDPHLWLSPRRMRAELPALASALADVVPADAERIAERAAALDTELAALDAELRSRFEAARGRRFFVQHPAWGSLAEDYGLVQVAIEGEGKEPSVRDLERRIDEARRSGTRVVFGQPQIEPSAARLVADAVGARVETLDPFAPDWAVALRASSRRIAEALVP
jgi:zinc transport system substrate-binding protein